MARAVTIPNNFRSTNESARLPAQSEVRLSRYFPHAYCPDNLKKQIFFGAMDMSAFGPVELRTDELSLCFDSIGRCTDKVGSFSAKAVGTISMSQVNS